MELTPIYKRIIGLDVHQAKISACAVAEQADGTVTVESREFGGFKRDRRALAEWAKSFGPDVVVMESTGIYWKSPYAGINQSKFYAAPPVGQFSVSANSPSTDQTRAKTSACKVLR